MDDTPEARAQRRRVTWSGTISRSGEHRPAGYMVPDLALAAMWELAQAAWELSGRPLPTYTRATMPGRLLVDGRLVDGRLVDGRLVDGRPR